MPLHALRGPPPAILPPLHFRSCQPIDFCPRNNDIPFPSFPMHIPKVTQRTAHHISHPKLSRPLSPLLLQPYIQPFSLQVCAQPRRHEHRSAPTRRMPSRRNPLQPRRRRRARSQPQRRHRRLRDRRRLRRRGVSMTADELGDKGTKPGPDHCGA